MPRPHIADYAPYFEKYITKVAATDAKELIDKYAQPLRLFYTDLPASKADYKYAAGKWTLKDLLQHIIDTERIMAYRLLRIARNDSTPNPSFDENSFALNAGAARRSFDSIKEEFITVRKATDLLLQSLTEEQLSFAGMSGNHRTTANAIAFILFGHLLHHKQIVEEKYL